jgi:hypothetical protein
MIAVVTLSLYVVSLTLPLTVSYSYRPITIKSTLKSTAQKLSPIDIHDQLSIIHSSHIDGVIHQLHHLQNSFFLSDDLSASAITTTSSTDVTEPVISDVAASAYTKTDKTGVIGFFATYIELAIDFGHSMFNKIGIVNSYGYSIILFTLLGM